MTARPILDRRKYALCVGINSYGGPDLKGCVADANDWTALLRGQGYEVAQVLDSDATKSTVVSYLRGMVDAARFGDRIVATYSGHGSWMPDADGDEADRRDECLVLHDFRTGGLLTDDELNAIFAARRFGVRVVVISDSCHSGTLHRAYGPTVAAEARPRFLPPVEFMTDEEIQRATLAGLTLKPARNAPPRPTTALLSGCADPEFSYDAFIDGRYRGAFTARALEVYRPGISLAAWHKAITTPRDDNDERALPSAEYPQSPQIAATSSQRRWSL